MKERGKVTMQKTCLENCIKMFFTAFSIGLILSGCNKKDDRKEDIEIVKESDSSKTKSVANDTTTISKKKLEQTQRDLPKAVQIELKQTTPIASKNDNANKTSKSDKVKKEDSSSALKPLSNINAEFPGGIEQFHNFFMKEYKKPENVNYWKLNFTLAFAVEKNGSVSFLECSPAVEEPLEKEIIRVLSLCPKWQPGESNGKKTRMQYSVPILLK